MASFCALYERHYRLAIGIAASRLNDLHLAEDAAQEAFAIACRQLPLLQDGQRFAHWLGTICRRTAIRIARRLPKHTTLSEAFLNLTAASPSESNLPEGGLIPQLQNALSHLAESSREVILLHYYSGLSYQEIALVLGISTQSVHGRLQRARRALAADLSRHAERERTNG